MVYFAGWLVAPSSSGVSSCRGVSRNVTPVGVVALDKIGAREKVLLLPPDITRLMSKAGELACAAHAYYGGAVADVMPALGTHAPAKKKASGGFIERVIQSIRGPNKERQ